MIEDMEIKMRNLLQEVRYPSFLPEFAFHHFIPRRCTSERRVM